jgi:hypothetical protein
VAQVPAAAWGRYCILEGAKGPLLADCVALRVAAVRDRLPGPTVWLLIRRTIPAPGEAPVYTFYLSSASADLLPQPVCLSPMQIRLLPRVTLPQPAFDLAATLEVIDDQQWHKQGACSAPFRR